ncbi:hypothetical protein VB776_08385 [Arcicella sp. DC2W]|uniref:Uncharacterized protein n=1 Tax=Arcicella gelida TaxID=2984195 RepID=A0ABU5S356_9BACT|nr:hypothetical protein [Arcicella sp. DC2W]MEA5402928.1 hypothetical protein [Arcicella sp. DC2W]
MDTLLTLEYQVVVSTIKTYHERLQTDVEQMQAGLSFLNQYCWEVSDVKVLEELQKIKQELLRLLEMYYQNISICEKIYRIFDAENVAHSQQIAREIALIEQSFVCAECQYQRLTEYLNK